MRWLAVDLFSVLPPAQWGVIMMIRTGPAEFARRVVTRRDAGGWLPSHLAVRDGAIWDGDQIVETPEEADVWRVLEMDPVAPEDRR